MEALADTPVVFLRGPRQCGKTTLVRWLAQTSHPARYVTLDDLSVLAAAREDPEGFLGGLGTPLVLDEVQRAPELLLAIKARVDRNRKPGGYLLTGSADVLLLPQVAEFLVGRMEVLTLWPLSQSEIEGSQHSFIDGVFSADPLRVCPPNEEDRSALLRRALRGGYPEALQRGAAKRRHAWFASYITTVIQRDVRDLANINGLTTLPRLLSLIAARSMGLVNFAELSRTSGIPQTTLKRYLALLKTAFIIQTLPAWSGNLSKRLVRSPKLLLSDTGLMAHLLGMGAEGLSETHSQIGPLVENFVVMELRKQVSFSERAVELFHFRTQAGREIDVVLEDAAGNLVGVEVKAASTVQAKDFDGLKALAEEMKGAAPLMRFLRGIVLYTGHEVIPFSPDLHALPLSCLL